MERPICPKCHQRHVGINYIRHGKTYYRSKCDSCIRGKKGKKLPKPNWAKVGYKKKMVCDKCGFTARWPGQLVVYYVDGDLNNTKLTNLKSVCLNCTVVITKQGIPWARDMGPDTDV